MNPFFSLSLNYTWSCIVAVAISICKKLAEPLSCLVIIPPIFFYCKVWTSIFLPKKKKNLQLIKLDSEANKFCLHWEAQFNSGLNVYCYWSFCLWRSRSPGPEGDSNVVLGGLRPSWPWQTHLPWRAPQVWVPGLPVKSWWASCVFVSASDLHQKGRRHSLPPSPHLLARGAHLNTRHCPHY